MKPKLFGSFRNSAHAAALAALCPLLLAHANAQVADQGTLPPRVRTVQGTVEGTRKEALAVFKGIPFARAPVGDLRWREPDAPRSWKGVRDATQFAPACMQVANPAMNIPSQPVSEDCLYLNVWSPYEKGKRLPVLVWIHGGGFSFGSTAMPLFDGAPLARRGVVFVSIAYRLGPFGYLAHPALTQESRHHASGNYALMDQIAALRWIKANIGRFGGDPSKVTIMGESAGAISAGGLVQSPLARGLFRGVIAQSGANFGPEWGAMRTLAQGEEEGVRWAAAVSGSTLRELRDIPAEKLIGTTPQGKYPFTRMASLPIIDGYVLPDDPLTLYRNRRFNDTPILIGNNALEGALFPPVQSANQFLMEVRKRFGPGAGRVLSAYPASNDAEAARSWALLKGDEAFALPEYTWAMEHQRYGRTPVFFYHFAHNPPLRAGGKAGPVHGAELPYALGTMSARPVAWLDADWHLANLLGKYWSNFAKYGDPNGKDLPTWPRFDAHSAATMRFTGEGATVGEVASREHLDLLSELIFEPRPK